MTLAAPASTNAQGSLPALAFLDDAYTTLRRAPRPEHVHALIDRIDAHRRALAPDAWRTVALAAQVHPLAALLLQDPYTARAFAKPRGYAGDAVMLDYLYGTHEVDPATLTPVGHAVWTATTGAASAEAVRDRRRRLAATVDAVATRCAGAEILSVAAGHAREIELSQAFREGRVSRWRCLDQDTESLEAITRRHPHDARVEAIRCPVRNLLREGVSGSADLVYTAGLLDYLGNDVARALLERLWAAVRPGGQLVVANFANDSRERGYMEAFMDWWLIYRAEDDLRSLGSTLDGAALRIFRDETRRTVWLEARRAP
jgi:SAM-dependent methyltransferase